MLRKSAFLVCVLLASVLGAGGCSDGGSPGNDSGIIPCTTEADCPEGLACLDGLCAATSDGGCTFDVDCPQGQVCRQGECVPEVPDGGDGGDGEDGEDGEDGQDGGDEAPVPGVAVEPALIDFGNGRVGQVVEQILRIRSVGGADLTVFSIQFDASTSQEFGAAPLGSDLNEVIQPGASLEVRVTYSPLDGSIDHGVLLISTDAPSQALVQVPLSSSYKGVSEISVSADPASDLDDVQVVDFGPVALGGAAHRVVYVKNTGNGNAVLEIQEVRTNPLTSDHFSLAVSPLPPVYLSPSTGPCGQDEDCGEGNLCQGGVCMAPTGEVLGAVAVAIDYAPAAVGPVQEWLQIDDDEGDGAGDGDERVRLIALRGEGIQPNLSVEPNPIDFGTLFTGQRAELPVTLRNLGGQALTLLAIELVDGSGPFALDLGGLASWTLLPGESAELLASFAPEEAGAQQDTLEVQSDDPDSPARVDLIGQAVLPPVLEIAPEALAFGEVQLGQSLELTFTVHNAGGGPLQVTDLTLVTGGPEFSLVEQALPPLDPAGSSLVHVAYSPSGGIGADAGLVRVRSDDPARPEATVSLDGLGTDPAATLDPPAMDFGAVYPGSTAGPRLAIVRNSGFGTLRVSSLGLVGSADFNLGTVTPAVPTDLAFGEAVQIEVFFSPQSAGARSAELAVTTSDLDAPSLQLPIVGQGSDCPYGWWDANHDPTDGCEYACELSAGGVEECDGLDNDCDAETDEALNTRTCSWTVPGVGTCQGEETCAHEGGWVGCTAVEPQPETCNTLDDDCDEAVDALDNSLRLAPCELELGVCLGAVHRAALCQGGAWQPCATLDYGADYGPEACDRLDSDCDGLTDAEDPDLLPEPCPNQLGVCGGALHLPAQCSLGVWQDCTDAEYEARDPRFGDEVCDGEDNDCDGQVDGNDSGLLLPPCEKQLGLCAGAAMRPGLCYQSTWHPCLEADYQAHDPLYADTELCDGLDNDCSGAPDAVEVDADGDGFMVCAGDCDDTPGAGAAIHPGAAEVCDGDDNDCDGYADAADPQLLLTPCELTEGVCADTYHRADQCVSGLWAACNASNYGAGYGPEVCDAGLDNDCDGQTNAADTSLVLAPCENQAGVCSGAMHLRSQCQLNGTWQSCAASEYEAHDARYGDEVCDGVDNNCNALLDQVDPVLVRPLCEIQSGLCAGAVHRASLCQGAGGFAACDATDYEAHDPDYNPTELCDRIDNDCVGGLPTNEMDGDGDGFAPCEGDCLDSDFDVNPGELEVCNLKDDDCDGYTDALDGSLALAPCELQAGVCAGSEHSLNQCVGGGWLPCTDAEYINQSAYFGEEVCGDAANRDEDCSGLIDDRDSDEDGHLHLACGGDDCNDESAAAYPGATEVQDLTDNDCDALVDEGTIPVGTIIVTELLANPDAVPDETGEWFEVYNDSAVSVNLHSWRIRDTQLDSFTVAAPDGLVIAPGESLVFCRSGDLGLNGGVLCDYVYGEDGPVFTLGQTDDEIILTLDGVVIDQVSWASVTLGRSRSLDPSAYDDVANDTAANWCATPTNPAYQLPGGDYGTPGHLNVLCAGSIALASVTPASGIEQGGETLTLLGTGFTGATAVTVCGAACATFTVIDDNTITCLTAAHVPADCNVSVTKGPASSTLTAAYRYTGVDASPGIGWCDLQWPLTATTRVETDSELIFGRVWKSGVTEPVGAPAGITGQLGYGPLGSDPRSTPGWRWLSASWNPSCSGCGNNDEFMRQFNMPTTGTWSYVYRFSDDGGFTFVFCDFNPGAPPFSSGEMGTLTVTP